MPVLRGTRCRRSRTFSHLLTELFEPVVLGGRVGRIKLEPVEADERKLRGGGVDVPDRRPRSRHASVIAAANRPEETLVMRRTSSIGAIVPPPVTTTFMEAVAPLLALLLQDWASKASLA